MRGWLRDSAVWQGPRTRWLVPLLVACITPIVVLLAFPARPSAEVTVSMSTPPPKGTSDLATALGSAALLQTAARLAAFAPSISGLRRSTSILQHGPDVTTATLVVSAPSQARARALATAWARATTRWFPIIYPYTAWVLSDQPNGLWQLNEGRGRLAVDVSGYGSDGRYVGNVVRRVPVGSFHGAGVGGRGAFVAVAGTKKLDARNALTVEAWIRPTRLPQPGQPAGVVSKWDAFFLRARGASGGGASLVFSLHGNSGWSLVDSGRFRLRPGRTYLVAGTYDGRRLRLYADGRLVGEAATRGPITRSAYQLEIGRSGAYYYGGVAQVAFYEHALTASQIAAHYAGGAHDVLDIQPVLTAGPARGKSVAAALALGIVLAAVVVVASRFRRAVPTQDEDGV
jgi:hypothetical protein